MKIVAADAIDTTGATKIKAFLWENLENCKPLYDWAEEIITLHHND